jgi:HAD superfamily hydrolase (TIGR01450 family)
MPLDFSAYAAVLLDLDGTLYHEDHPLPGAAALVARLRRENRRFACLSNSTLSPRQISDRLHQMGMDIDPDRIYPATEACADYVLEKYGSPHSPLPHFPAPRPRIYNLATTGLHEMLEGKVDWVQRADQSCDAVVAGCSTNPYATEDRQRIALVLLRNGAELVGMCADRVFPSPRGLEFGSGALSAMLAYAANVKPTFCGKPEKTFFLELCHKLNVDPARCILIGDNPESDIAGAKPFGMSTALILTGVTRRVDLPHLPPHLRPDAVFNDLTEL